MEHVVDPIANTSVPRRHTTATRGAVTAIASAIATAIAIVVALAAGLGLGASSAAAAAAAADTDRPIDVQQWGGALTGVAVAGDVAYAAIGPQLVVVDVADAAAPRIIGRSALLDDLLTHLFVRGNRLYGLSENRGLVVFDVTDPNEPRIIGRFATLGQATDLDIVGDVAYICDDKGGLRIVSVTDPTQPIELNSWGPMAGTVDTAVVDGGHVFTVVGDNPSSLVVLNVTGPRPTVAAQVELDVFGADDLALAGGWLYLASSEGIVAIDVSAPLSPTVGEGEAADTGSVNTLLADGDTVWAAGSGHVWVLDGRDPPSLRIRSVFEVDNVFFPAVAVDGGRAYFADSDGLRIVDVGDPFAEPVVGGWAADATFDRHAVDVARRDDFVVVAVNVGGLKVLDVSDPTTATEIASLPAVDGGGAGRGTFRVTLAGDRAYTAEEGLGGGVRVIDLRDPTQPRDIGRISAPGVAGRPAVAGDLVAVPTRGTDAEGVRLYRIAASGVPSALGWLPLDHGVDTVALAGTRLYAGGDEGLWIADVTDPRAPVVLGSLTEISAWGGIVVLDAGRIIVGDVNYGLFEVDVADPSAPVVAARYPLSGGADQLVRSGDDLWVANNYAGVSRLALAPGVPPRVVGHWFIDQAVFAVAPGDDEAWLVVQEGGLIALDRAAPSMPRDSGVLSAPGYMFKVAIAVGRIAVRSGLNIDRMVVHVLDDGAPMRPLGHVVPDVYLAGAADPGDALAMSPGIAWLPGGSRAVIGYDVREPSMIRRLTADDGPGTVVVQHLAVDGATAVGLTNKELLVLDLTDPVRPVVTGQVNLPRAFAVAIADRTAWALVRSGDDRTDLAAFDIATPAAVTEHGRWPLPSPAYGLAADGDRLAIAVGMAGLLVWDIARPAAAYQLSALPFRGLIDSVAVADGIAWAVEQWGDYTVHAIDLDAAGGAVEVGSAALADWWEGNIAAEGRTAVVANGHAGLYVLHIAARDPAVATRTPSSVATPTAAPPARPAALYLPLAFANRPSPAASHAVLALDRSAAMGMPSSAGGDARRFDVGRAVVQAAADGWAARARSVTVVAYDAQAERLPLAASTRMASVLAGLTLGDPAARHDVALAAMKADIAHVGDRCTAAVLITAGRSTDAAADAVALARSAALRALGVRTFVVRVGADAQADPHWLAALAGDGHRLLEALTMGDAATVGAALAASMDGCP